MTDPAPHTPEDLEDLQEKIIGRIKTIYDPEIPVNIYDLGLIYKIEAFPAAEGDLIDLTIDMTLTAPGCPIADTIIEMVHSVLADMPEFHTININLVWEPPWDKDRMTDEAKLALNLFD